MQYKEAHVKRLALIATLILSISACAPQVGIENNVLPTVFSVRAPSSPNGLLVIQGRYFGDGQSGQSENSYVLLGADVNGDGGIAVRANTWSPNRIEVTVPAGAGSGFVFVVVDGLRSNALSANLP